MKAKDYEDVTLQDVIDVMTDKEKEVTGVNDLKLLYYGRTLLDEIEEE